ncbi:MAG: ABC transporter ATP-binding protein [Herpetosiphon sp.]|nr:ABC transporter ATP-binding protein [Herpetosiphon sp.]
MKAVITVNDLTKTYGSVRGIQHVNFDVTEGEVFGFLGPNGAGKTTTIRTLLDFIRPSSGSASILGMDSHRDSLAIRRQVSYLPGELVMYEHMTGRDLLNYFANLRGGVPWSEIEAIAKRLELDTSRKIRTLSKGNKQKVGLVQAFMGKPKVMFLDEPTSGLDPLMQQIFYELVRDAQANGSTVFLSSHLLAEVEHICDRVGIIRAGELLVVDTVASLKEKSSRSFDFYFAQPVPITAFDQLEQVQNLHVDGKHVHCSITGSVNPLIKAVAQFELENIVTHQTDLEDVFLTYYKGEVSHAA